MRTRQPIASKAMVARSIGSRLLGLLGHRSLEQGEGLMLPHCSSIHTCGMRFSIDAVFVDQAWRVVALKPRLSPWRVVLPVPGAWGVVEVACGTLERVGMQVGDQLQLASEGGDAP